MSWIMEGLLLTIWLLSLCLIQPAASNLTPCHGQIPVPRDVCIIGGGAAGTYAAIQLHDLGLSVILVEKEAVLGGQTNTYTDPITGQTIDYGVNQFQDIPEMREYLARLNVSYDKHQPSGESLIYFNFRTGETVSGYRPDIADAFAAYRARVSMYPELDYGFSLADPIPDELLTEFRHTVAAYNFSGILSRTWFGQGDILNLPTLYAYKSFGVGVLDSIETGFLFTTRHNNYEIYARAQEVLSPDVLLQSTVAGMDRSRNDLCVCTPSSARRFHCGRFVVAIPPLIDNLHGFDLSTEERFLFSQFKNVGYYTSLVRIPGLSQSSNFSAFENIDLQQAYDLPLLPGLYRIFPTVVPDLHIVEYGAPFSISDRQVKMSIMADVGRLRHAGYIQPPDDAGAPEFVEFKSHTPYLLQVSAEAIRSGFYRRLYGLQGQLKTYYTGAAFHAQDTALLVRFTKELVNEIYVSLAQGPHDL